MKNNLDKRKEILEKLFCQYKQPMHHYALKITNDFNLAEDTVQDAFCKIIKYIDSINYEDDRAIKSYLFAVTKTCAIDNCRQNKAVEVVTDSFNNNVNVIYLNGNSNEDFDVDKAISEIAFEGDIGEIISNLKEEDQLILYLRYARNASDEEIADILNLKTTEAVRKRLSRAKSRLRDLYNASERK
ncbi:MAG: RNA polymerase sigma factor [Thermacetogeniaceae bacterium]